METVQQQLRVVIFRDGDLWAAQCLEYDIGAQAHDLKDLQTRFVLTVKAEVQESVNRHGEPFKGIDPAPQHFHEMWEGRSGSFTPLETNRPTAFDGHLTELDMALCA